MKKIIIFLLCLGAYLTGSPATFTVTSTADSGPGTLRQALIDASPGDNISFAVTGVITVSSYLDISKDVHILGPGANLLAIDGGGTTQIFKDANYTLNPVEIVGLEIRNGKGASYGGAIAGLGYNLTIRNCDIHHNTLTASYGGAISVWSVGASLTIQNSTLHDNSSSTYAGCIYLQDQASLTITNSTLYHNTGSAAGQAIYANGATINLTNVTIAGHTTGSSAINLGDDFSTNAPCNITMQNCIVDNTISNYTFFTTHGGTENSLGHNISNDGSMFSVLFDGTDMNVTNVQLDPMGLQLNGGITPTVRPMCQSPAINAGSNVLTTDQNGAPISGGARDIGAYETNYTPPTVVAHASGPGTCEGDANILYGSGATSYTWSNGVMDNVPFYPTASGTYTVTGTDLNGCIGTDNINIVVELTSGFSAGTDMDVCRTTPMIVLNGNSPSGNAFIWTTLGSGSFVNGSTLTPDYYLSGADASSDSVAIVLEATYTYCANHVDTLVLYMRDPATAYAGGDLNGCSNEPNGITVNGSPTNYNSIVWSSANGGSFTSTTTLTTFYTANALDISTGTATIYLSVNPLYGVCPIATDTMQIIFHTPPTFNLGADYTICETDSILLQTSITGGTPPFIYNWSNGATISTANNEMYLPPATENISLLVNDMYGCYGKDTVQVTVDASELLSGTMHVGAGVLTDGTMYMFKFIPQQQIFDTLFVYPFSGGSGSFSFSSFPHGDYLIKIIPDTLLFPNLLPTYYGDAFQWDSATVISHNCTNPFVADINLIALLGGTGSGSISGYVLEDIGFGQRYATGGHHDHVLVPGGPLKGIDVKLGKNPGGGIQARTMTDTTGHYAFEDLPNDSYRIYVDIPGLPMDSFYIVTINTTADTAINLNYYADSNSVYPILPTVVGFSSHKYVAENFDVYPNPAKNFTSLRFEVADQSTATIRLLDITGKTLLTTQLRNLPKGKHEYQLNFEDHEWKSGIYFIEVQSGEGVQVKKLVIE